MTENYAYRVFLFNTTANELQRRYQLAPLGVLIGYTVAGVQLETYYTKPAKPDLFAPLPIETLYITIDEVDSIIFRYSIFDIDIPVPEHESVIPGMLELSYKYEVKYDGPTGSVLGIDYCIKKEQLDSALLLLAPQEKDNMITYLETFEHIPGDYVISKKSYGMCIYISTKEEINE
jgi:hypothetical protein